MYPFSVTILGSSSATPTSERNPTSQLLIHREKCFLIDCGEGTQVALRKQHVHFQRINHIFISHLHGDHFFGLIGLISSMHLLGRTKELTIYGPKELKQIIEIQLQASQTILQYPLVFIVTQAENPSRIYENSYLEVISFPLLHRIPTTGFLFREKPKERHIRKDVVDLLRIPFLQLQSIRQGSDFVNENGELFKNEMITSDADPSRTYAFCSDTAYFEDIIPTIHGADLLYHETTFMNNKAVNAAEKFHSTTGQAALIALKAGVKKLLIGHFSARYDDITPLLVEAREVFKESYVACEGQVFDI